MIKINEQAPDFSLPGFFKDEIKTFHLKDYQGKWLVLFSYPADFTFVCPTEVKGFNEHFDKFHELDAEVAGISVDSPWSHKAWVEKEWGKLEFPLLSDTERTVLYRYGMDTKDEYGSVVALRATCIIDPEGKLKYYVISDNNIGRSVEETLRVLQALQTGQLCPVDWKPGEKTLNEK